jgi:hypothetical protein
MITPQHDSAIERSRPSSMQRCMDACERCALECERCATASLHDHDLAVLASCIELCRDCADVCVLAARMMSRGSTSARVACRACLEICATCARECDWQAAHHEHVRRCAEVCHACIEECRRVLF